MSIKMHNQGNWLLVLLLLQVFGLLFLSIMLGFLRESETLAIWYWNCHNRKSQWQGKHSEKMAVVCTPWLSLIPTPLLKFLWPLSMSTMGHSAFTSHQHLEVSQDICRWLMVSGAHCISGEGMNQQLRIPGWLLCYNRIPRREDHLCLRPSEKI